MRKKFKSKKQSKFKIKYILLIIGIYFISKFTFSYLISDFKINNIDFINILLSESNKSINYDISSKIKKTFTKIIRNPNSLLSSEFDSVIVKTTNVETDNYTIINKDSNYVEDKNNIKVDKPLIYIYNTHQYEDYKDNTTVMNTSYSLRDELLKYKIESIVEKRDIKEIMNLNNTKDWYKGSRYLVNDAVVKYESVKYYIDIHRDSVSHKSSTLTNNSGNYAKTYFVIGKEHENYEKNMELAKKIDIKLNSLQKGISKGILLKEGKGVDGKYNQDIHNNVILIEFGGVDNTFNEIENTTKLVAQVLAEIINENK